MESPPQPPLAGLNPADLLAQGVAEDTIGNSYPFQPSSLEEMATLFPQFEIFELIGKGGMGAVYKVRQKELDRIVALKILSPAIGRSPAFSSRFAREAKALAKLNHPGIVTLYEFGSASSSTHQPSTPDHQLFYFLMEYVDGVNLGQLMHTGQISPREALAIVPQICDALQFAHDQGIVHRDIKPENILLDRLGRVKVADFGIAKLSSLVVQPFRTSSEDEAEDRFTTEPTAFTEAGKVLGTPQYMAPEQFDHPADVDHRADIYALGVVFYQMLTGELPGKDLQAPSKKVRIDVRLDEIVLKALEKEPQQRYQQVSVMRTRVDDLGEETEPPSPVATVPPAVKKHPVWKWGMMACAVLFLMLLVISSILTWVYWSLSAISKLGGGNGAHEIQPNVGILSNDETPAVNPIEQTVSVLISGEIRRVGSLWLKSPASLLDAVAAAGGWTDRADIRKITISHPGAQQPEIHDLQAIFDGRAVNPKLEKRSSIIIATENN